MTILRLVWKGAGSYRGFLGMNIIYLNVSLMDGDYKLIIKGWSEKLFSVLVISFVIIPAVVFLINLRRISKGNTE